MVCPVPADMNSCTPKCICGSGVCAGEAFSCLDPCEANQTFDSETCECIDNICGAGQVTYVAVGQTVTFENTFLSDGVTYREFEFTSCDGPLDVIYENQAYYATNYKQISSEICCYKAYLNANPVHSLTVTSVVPGRCCTPI